MLGSGNKKEVGREGGRDPSILIRNLKEEDSSLILATGNMISSPGASQAFNLLYIVTRSPLPGLVAHHCFHKVL